MLMKELAGHLEPCVSRGNAAAPRVTLVRPRGFGAQEVYVWERDREMCFNGEYIRSVTRGVVVWLRAREDLTTGTRVQLEYLPDPILHDSGSLLFATLWDPDGKEMGFRLPATAVPQKEEELSRLIFGTQHGIQSLSHLRRQFGQNSTRCIQLVPPFRDNLGVEDDGDDEGPSRSRYFMCLQAEVAVFMLSTQLQEKPRAPEWRRKKKGRECFERFGMSLQHQSFWIEIMKRERGPERDSGSLIISPRPDEFSTAHTHQRPSSTGASAPVVFTRSRQTDRLDSERVVSLQLQAFDAGLTLMAQHFQSGYGFQAAGAWRGCMSIFNPEPDVVDSGCEVGPLVLHAIADKE
ncbi:hypothetical protein E1301_Tti014801 [Triplophysa tibetana]|uniref:Uncharacterized protein n=1 Tax=Triplophysa tibetana TaxID=1572043 RepID=A0A5A9PXQ8_9TELE|nr:hypothetical protein E1301_Tti014801 [Triplophysa tibetana]